MTISLSSQKKGILEVENQFYFSMMLLMTFLMFSKEMEVRKEFFWFVEKINTIFV
jgi:hypothetical protein